ncbi:hypothetical protein TYRP_008373 [Tyrophagus putrescentiae]|nr:hypothetical protein TYRP_008373 [Tyrophagus putrescentiae]
MLLLVKMGHWILEVTKIGVYIALPLSSFIIFNSPSFYTPVLYEWRKKTAKYARNDEIIRQSQREFAEEMRRTQSD